jgi:hypothetical protein
MIGDQEYPEDREQGLAEQAEGYGPLDAMVRLEPPVPPPGQPPTPPAYVERYDRFVVLRHVFLGGEEVTHEVLHPSAAHAIRAMATAIGALQGRGYRLVAE